MNGPIMRMAVCAALAIALSFFSSPAFAKEGNAAKEIADLGLKSESLGSDAVTLLERVRKMRTDELEKMRGDIEKKLRKWEDGDVEMGGRELRIALQNAYFVAEGYGMDVPHLKGIYELSKRMIRRADFPQFCGSGIGTTKEFTEPVKDTAVIGNMVHYFNLVDKKEERMACAQKNRVRLYKEINSEFLRALSTPDPVAAADAFRKYADALRAQITGQEMEAIQADLKVLADEQANVALFFSVIPLVGDAMDAMAIKEGEDIAGQKLSALEKSFNALMLLAPNALEMAVKRIGKMSIGTVKAVYGYLRVVSRTEGTALYFAAKAVGASVDLIKKKTTLMLARLGESAGARLAKETGKKAMAAAEDAVEKAAGIAKKWAQSEEGAKAMATWKAAKKAGQNKVKQIRKLLNTNADPESLLKAYRDLRMDKMALDELQKGKYLPLRKKIQRMENDLFGSVGSLGKVDKDAIDGLKAGFKDIKDAPKEVRSLFEKARKSMRSKVKGIAHKEGVPPGRFDVDEYLNFEDMEISVFNATNKAPSPGKIGFDRDITYRVKIPSKKISVIDPKTGITKMITIPAQEIDVPAEIVSKYYNKNLYKHLNPGKAVPEIGSKQLKRFGERMDHVVTDEYAIDSYRLGVEVRKFFKDPTLLAHLKNKGGNIGDTITHKSREWFHQADDFGRRTGVGMAHTKEGMRQASKQFENYAVSLRKYYDPASIKSMSGKLKNGLGIFKKVKKGTMSVPEAEKALQTLGTSKEEVVELFGSYFEGLLKTGKRKKAGGR